MEPKTLAILVLLLPLAGAVLVGAVGLRGLRAQSHWLVLFGVGAALAAAVGLFRHVQTQIDRPDGAGVRALANPIRAYEWIPTGGPRPAAPRAPSWFNVEFRVDSLTTVMLLTVLGVSLLVVAYSVGYMRDHHGHAERGYERFFAFLGLFVFSMCALVLAGNFLLLYLGWELVGLSSYLLIGFYYDRPSAAAAAKKAFLVNRVGDFGFGLGILFIYLTFGTLEYDSVFRAASAAASHDSATVGSILGILDPTSAAAAADLIRERLTLICLLLFCGAVGKSAQLPLHVWLPDAMEGPTPVSALIHAATMVTAGVYMVARCHVLFAASPYAMWFVACTGAATAFFAATIALTQFDMKRILAYSTVSQLGFMFLALGVGAFDSAIFHLFTHAFFKACLFLGAGSVMHAMAGVIDIRRFGGLRRAMPVTYGTFLIAGLALAGFPLLAGFWSKDEIVHAALHGDMPWLGGIALVTALLTAFYTFRMIFIAFHGPQRLPSGVHHAHESGGWMAVPLVILALGAIAGGYVGVSLRGGGFLGVFEPGGRFHAFLAPVLAGGGAHGAATAHGAADSGGHAVMWISAGLALFGILAAWFVYRRRPAIALAAAFGTGPVYRLLYHKYWIDELYDAAIVQPLRRFGTLCYALDRYVIDGLLLVISAVPRAVGFGLKGLQQGAVQGYALGMVVGLLAIVLWMLVSA